MTRRSWLKRAFAGAAFVAGTNFATLVSRAKHDRPRDYFRLEVGVEMEGMVPYKGKLMEIYLDVLSGGPHVPWARIDFSQKAPSVQQT